MESIAQNDLKLDSSDIRVWGDRAKCKGQPSNWWFAENLTTLEGKQGERRAKQVCMLCEVRVECLAYAEENGETLGVWGGLSPKERGVGRLARIARLKQSKMQG